jgi:hypothetical protein
VEKDKGHNPKGVEYITYRINHEHYVSAPMSFANSVLFK